MLLFIIINNQLRSSSEIFGFFYLIVLNYGRLWFQFLECELIKMIDKNAFLMNCIIVLLLTVQILSCKLFLPTENKSQVTYFQ